jgi:hypothetical protein
MFNRRFLIVLSILIAISIFPVLPPIVRASGDSGPVTFERIDENGIATSVHDGDVIPRDTWRLNIIFNESADSFKSLNQLNLKDSQGNATTFWNTYYADHIYSITFFPSKENPVPFLAPSLKRNASYTLTGNFTFELPNGVQQTLDFHLSLKTSDTPDVNKYIFSAPLNHPLNLGTNMYRLFASAGVVEMMTLNGQSADQVQIAVKDAIDGTEIVNQKFNGPVKLSVVLPHSGDYILQVTGVHQNWKEAQSPIQLKGTELKLNPLPSISIQSIKPYEIINQPFSLQIENVSLETKHVKVLVDDKLATEVPTEQLGIVKPAVMISPVLMSDGFHTVTFIAEGASGAKMTRQRTFLVDHADAFKDVPKTHWVHDQAEILHALGIVQGRGNGSFQPDETVTREEFAKMLALASGMKTGSFDSQTFADVPRSSWSFPYIEQLAATGQIQGEDVHGIRYFYPNRNITRVEAAAIINRNKALTGAPIKDIFRDFKQIPDWGRDAVTQLWNDHWISGYEDGNFYPFRTLTRAEAAKLLANLPTQEK